MHGRIGWCLAHADPSPVHAAEYGVRECAGWHWQADNFQAEFHRLPLSLIVR
jgi:hypothetical protein